ncbi:MAG: tail fiber domain-containing protein [Saprospiraceae bacterium]|nr:tail fiber domain-containing protein [Saprospiraceae bacterium]
MKKIFILLVLPLIVIDSLTAQTEVELVPDGVVVPRLNSAAVGSPVLGQVIYNTNTSQLEYHDGTAWRPVSGPFERDDTTIRQRAGFDSNVFIFGRPSLPENGEIITDNFFFFDKFNSSIRGGRILNSDYWATDSIGGGSVAFGLNVRATGAHSVALVSGSASGLGSVAIGHFPSASGNSSIALGDFVKATGNSCTALGIYNDPIVVPQTPMDNSSPVLIVGNGDFGNESNALVVRKDGHVGLGNNSPSQILHIVDSVAGLTAIRHENLADASTSNSVNIVHRLKTDSLVRIAFELKSRYDDIDDGSRNSLVEFLTQNDGTYGTALTLDGSTLRINNLGAGTVTSDIDGNLTTSSDIRLKEVEGIFKRGLTEIMQLDPIIYRWNVDSGMEMESTYTGFSAQDVMEVIPEAVSQDINGYLTLSDRPIIAALVNAVKELSTENQIDSVEALKQENDELKNMISDLTLRLEKLESR